MAKHTQTIRRLLPTNCLSAFEHLVELLLKGLRLIFRWDHDLGSLFEAIVTANLKQAASKIWTCAKPVRGQACNFMKKRDSGTVVFLWILRNFQENLFSRTPLDDCFLLEAKLGNSPYYGDLLVPLSEAYLELCETSKVELFCEDS